jgi:TIR domain-containing protein
MEPVLRIGKKEYHKTSNHVFEVSYRDLKNAHFIDLPFYSSIEVKNLPQKKDSFKLGISFTHSGGPHNEEFFIHFHITLMQPKDKSHSKINSLLSLRRLSLIKRVFKDFIDKGEVTEGSENRMQWGDQFYVGMIYSKYFTRDENPLLSKAIAPFIERFRQLLRSSDLLLFICHASEDKKFVDELAFAIEQKGFDIWYDKREIKVGESIVELLGSARDFV